jgi:predicted transcriptional regulator
LVTNYRNLLKLEKKEDALTHLTRAIYENQQTGLPVAQWDEISVKSISLNRFVHHHMTTHLFTAHEYDLARMVDKVMEWKDIHHMPVENERGEFTGLITASRIDKFRDKIQENPFTTAKDIMITDLISVTAETPIADAINIMRSNNIGSLPVLKGSILIGLLTTRDILDYTYESGFEYQGE